MQEYDFIERQTQRKTASKEDDLTGRQPHRQRKTTSQEDNLTGRLPHTKTTAQTDELQHIRMKTSNEVAKLANPGLSFAQLSPSLFLFIIYLGGFACKLLLSFRTFQY